MRKILIFSGAALILIFILLFMEHVTEKEVFLFTSPDGKYYLKVFRVRHLIPKFATPGDGNWRDYVYKLYASSNKECLATSAVVSLENAMLQHAAEQPNWLTNAVCVPDEQYLFYKR